MSNTMPADYGGTFIEWNLLQIIEANNLFSTYFIPWLILKYECSDIIFRAKRECSELSIRSQTRQSSDLSVRSKGVVIPVGEFKIGENQIGYLINNNVIENKLFFDFIVNSLKVSTSDGRIKLKVPFYGNIIFRLASILNCPEDSTIVCRVLNESKGISAIAERLLLILMNIDKIDKYDEEEESIFDLLYHSITNKNINFSDSLEEPIELLKGYINLDNIISY